MIQASHQLIRYKYFYWAKVLCFCALSLLLSFDSIAQGKYFTKTGKIEFFSKAPLEDIEAKNKTVSAVLDAATGAFQFSVVMKAFEFQKALMQEHFNDNYVESHKYPKADFRGSIINNSDINYSKSGTYPVLVKGKLLLHGVTKEIQASGTLKIEGDEIHAYSTFSILLSDYKIKIPSVVKDKISNTIRLSVNCKLQPLKK